MLVAIVISWYPPCCMVTCHGEFRHFIRYGQSICVALLGYLIPEAKSIIEDSENNGHFSFIIAFE